MVTELQPYAGTRTDWVEEEKEEQEEEDLDLASSLGVFEKEEFHVPLMLWQKDRRDTPKNGLYWQVCVWPGIAIGRDKVQVFNEFIKKEFNLKFPVRAIGNFPVVSASGDVVKKEFAFVVHQIDACHRFCPFKYRHGFKNLEDMPDDRYPREVYEAYPKLF